MSSHRRSYSASPLRVSCMLATQRARVSLARRAIDAYQRQTYAAHELVIACDDDAAAELRGTLADVPHQLVIVDHRAPLGDVRNAALELATGELVCQWDDDDGHHPERLETQVRALVDQRADACALTEHLHYDVTRRSIAWIDWHTTGARLEHTLFPGSLLARREAIPRYPALRLGEDTALLYELCRTHRVIAVRERPELYVYTYHGGNSYQRDHHQRLMRRAMPALALVERRAQIERGMLACGLPLPHDYRMVGP